MEPDSSNASKTMIEAQGLTKYYGPFIAVENITFAIPHGQIVAFLGPNGAGKTTTMKMLTGFLAPSAGAAQDRGARRRTGNGSRPRSASAISRRTVLSTPT